MKQYATKEEMIVAATNRGVEYTVGGDWGDVKDVAGIVANERKSAESRTRQFNAYSCPKGVRAQLGFVIDGFGWVKLA